MGENATSPVHGGNQLLKQHESTLIHIANETNRRSFLMRCKGLRIVPKFIQIKQKQLNFQKIEAQTKYETILNTFYFQLLTICISDCYSKLNYYRNLLTKTKNELSTQFTNPFLTDFYSKQNTKYENIFNKTKSKHKNKINILLNKQNIVKKEYKVNDNWIVNLTKIVIPKHIKYILSLGSKFSFNFNTSPNFILNTITNIENGIDSLNQNDKEIIRNKITNILTNYKNKINHAQKITGNQLNHYFKETKKFIFQHSSLYILSADKSNKTVLMEKEEYNRKMENLLGDSNTYKKETYDLTNKIQTKMNSLINKWLKQNYIDKATKNKLICHNGQPPYIYGLPKLHKNNIPLRPIVSTIGSATYNLSKFLSNILANILGNNEYHIKDSWDFHNFIKDKKIPNDHILVSFDVVSLYTNIPIELAMQSISEKWSLIKNHTTIPKNEFIEATKLCLSSTFFQFNNNFFSQIYGVAMGSPISATIANLVMEYLQNNVIKSLNFKPYFFKRFVDDCILCIPKDKLQYTLNKFNLYHPKLQFTHETEENNTINFLDICIQYDQNRDIKTNWYTKTVWSGRYLNFNSNTPSKYKKSVVNTLIDRAVILSDVKHRPKNLKKVREILENNDYPKQFTEPIIKDRVNKIYNSNSSNLKTAETKNYVSLDFNSEVNPKIKKVLEPFKITIAEKPANNSKTLYTKLKPKIPESKQTNVIYKIDCRDCPKTYIGQTKQYLKNRTKEHQNSLRKINENRTALSNHAIENLHNFDFNNVQILDYEINYKKRNIKEMIHIKKTKNTVNFRTDTDNLSSVYNNLIIK